VIETLGPGGGDGFCYDVDGRAYVASTSEHGIRVVEADGTVVDFLPIDGDGINTNCCFGGADLRTLFTTDAIAGTVVAWEAMPTPGLELPTWPGLAAGS
jgi:gluconolactonase